MKGEEQQAEKRMDGKADCGTEGASNRGAHAAKEQFLWVAKHFGRSQGRRILGR